MSLDSDIKAAKQLRVPWWGLLFVMVGGAPIFWLFDHFGRFDLALPALSTVLTLGGVIAIKWKLRRQVWFCITMTVIVALHLLLVFSVHWTTKWVPAVLIVSVCTADFYAVLAILSVVEKFVERPNTS